MIEENGKAGFQKKVLAGVLWSGLAKGFSQGIQFIIFIVLARLLSPSDFGLIGMIIVFSNIATLFVELGLGTALIHREDLTVEQTHAIFWLTIANGLLWTLLFYFCAGLIAGFYNIAALEPVSKVLSLNFLLGSFGIVPRALLCRDMHFDRTSKIDIFASSASGLCAIVLAFFGAGVWSLVTQNLFAAVFASVLLVRQSGYRPMWRFAPTPIKGLFRYGFYLSSFNFVNYWARNADNLIIGKFLGAQALGLYDLAYQLMLLPITQFISAISTVMFPAFSSIQRDRQRVKEIYLRMNGVICLTTFPILIGLLVTAEPFILGLYGPKWEAAVPALRILSVAGLTGIICNPVGLIYLSQGATDKMFRSGVIFTLIVVGGILIGSMGRSITSVALGYTVSTFIILYPCIQYAGRLIGMSFFELLKVLRPILCANVISGLCVFGLGLVLPFRDAHLFVLSIQVVFGLLVYLALITFLKIPAVQEVKCFIKRLAS